MSKTTQQLARNAIRKMTEEAIHEHLQAIRELYLKYNPDGNYLSIGMLIKKGYCFVNNSVIDESDKYKPLDAHWVDEIGTENSYLEEVPFMDA